MMQYKSLGIAVLLIAGGIAYYLFDVTNGDNVPAWLGHGNGRIEAVQVDIATKIPGRIVEVLVAEGDLLTPGEVVAKINSAQLRAQLLRAKAEVATAESQGAAATAAIAQAKAQLVLAEQELERAKALVDRGHTSIETFDTRVSNRDVAKANLAAAEATLVARQRSAEAAMAGVSEIQTQIDDCTLVSPTTGRVLYRLAETGEVLGSGGKVATLLDLSDVYMEIFLPADQAARVAIGAEARIKLDILDVAIPAKVSFVSPQSQFTPKQVETEAERAKLMFRIKVRVPRDLVLAHIEKVKTGVRGQAYVRLSGDEQGDWPKFLQKLPAQAAPATNVGTSG